MIKSRYVKGYLGYYYSSYNHGKSSTQSKRNRRKGMHIIRQRQKRQLRKELEDVDGMAG